MEGVNYKSSVKFGKKQINFGFKPCNKLMATTNLFRQTSGGSKRLWLGNNET